MQLFLWIKFFLQIFLISLQMKIVSKPVLWFPKFLKKRIGSSTKHLHVLIYIAFFL